MSEPTSQIAVLLTCHNRRATTVRCLESLFSQDALGRVSLRVFLVDDGSTDGTAEAVGRRFPQTQVIAGDGSLFWCGGMRLAFEAARRAPERFDYYLWLNDDAFLRCGALSRLLTTHRDLAASGRPGSIVVGSTVDPNTHKPSYGGLRRLWPLPFVFLVRPGSKARRCTTMNGNCVLVPRAAAHAVGPIEPKLKHLCGDIDYGLRATERGYEIWMAPGVHADCEINATKRWHDVRLSVRQRFEALRQPRYSLAEKALVARRHFGPLWFLTPLAHYAYILLTRLLRPWLRRRMEYGRTERHV